MPQAQIRVQGHFGEWIQGKAGPDGRLTLVTVACPALTVNSPAVDKPHAAALFDLVTLNRFASLLERPIPTTWPTLQRTMPAGAGAGASTATLIALARAIGFDGAPEHLAQACLAVEGASDPLMFDAPDGLIWQSRNATAVCAITPPPACEIIGGFWGEPERTDPADTGFADVDDLLRDWITATEQSDLTTCAHLATMSAARCTAMRGPANDPLPELVRELGALGYVRAHTGSARGLIFAPDTVPTQAHDLLIAAGLRDVLQFGTGREP